jgi:hypothetical protein
MNPLLLCRIWLVTLSCLLPLRAGETELRDLLRDALYTEEVARDPEKAAKQYEELLSRQPSRKFRRSASSVWLSAQTDHGTTPSNSIRGCWRSFRAEPKQNRAENWPWAENAEETLR